MQRGKAARKGFPMSLISKLAKMSATDRAAYLNEQAQAAAVLASKAENIANARIALATSLETLSVETDAAIAAIETAATARAEVIASEIATRFGIDGSALRSSSLTGTKVPMRYRNPADHSQVWSGRGREPLWIAAIGGLEKCEDLRAVAERAAA